MLGLLDRFRAYGGISGRIHGSLLAMAQVDDL
jgi:hypothetical protein